MGSDTTTSPTSGPGRREVIPLPEVSNSTWEERALAPPSHQETEPTQARSLFKFSRPGDRRQRGGSLPKEKSLAHASVRQWHM